MLKSGQWLLRLGDMGPLFPLSYYFLICIVLHGWENPSSCIYTCILCTFCIYVILFKTFIKKYQKVKWVNYIENEFSLNKSVIFFFLSSGRKYTKI